MLVLYHLDTTQAFKTAQYLKKIKAILSIRLTKTSLFIHVLHSFFDAVR
jgi:hypothetical protein